MCLTPYCAGMVCCRFILCIPNSACAFRSQAAGWTFLRVAICTLFSLSLFLSLSFFILYLLNFPFSLFSPSLLLSLSRSLASLASPLGKIKANIEELSEIHTRHSETADALRAQGLIEAKLMQLGYQISTFNFRTVRFLSSSRLLSSSFCSSSSSLSFLFQIKVRTLLLEGWIANPIWRNYIIMPPLSFFSPSFLLPSFFFWLM